MDINYKMLRNIKNRISDLTNLRCRAYGMENGCFEMFYINEIMNGRMLAFVAYDKKRIVGACYVHDQFGILYIDQLFVDPDYQEKGYHIGIKLLNYVLKHKKVIDEFYDKEFKKARLEPINEKAYNLYYGAGFREYGSLGDMLKNI